MASDIPVPTSASTPEGQEGVSPFDAHLGLSFDQVGPEKVVARLDVAAHHTQPYGIVHGGVYCSMAETTASYGAAVANRAAGREQGAVGQSNHTDFLRATREGILVATAVPVHVGRSVQLWQVEITCGDRLVASSKVRMFNLDA